MQIALGIWRFGSQSRITKAWRTKRIWEPKQTRYIKSISTANLCTRSTSTANWKKILICTWQVRNYDLAVTNLLLLNTDPDATTFNKVQQSIWLLMAMDSYPRFINSDLYKNYLKGNFLSSRGAFPLSTSYHAEKKEKKATKKNKARGAVTHSTGKRTGSHPFCPYHSQKTLAE